MNHGDEYIVEFSATSIVVEDEKEVSLIEKFYPEIQNCYPLFQDDE